MIMTVLIDEKLFRKESVVRKLDDQQLITLMQNDPEKGVEQAIRQYGGLCKAVTVRILGADHQQDIEECISDTFLKLWRAVDGIDLQKGNLKAYAASIARNTAINRLRSQKRVYELLPLEEDGLEMELDLESELSRKRNGEIVRQTVLELPEPDREIFIRRYFYCERVKAIALQMGLSPKAVENKLFRGRQRLKELLIQRGASM